MGIAISPARILLALAGLTPATILVAAGLAWADHGLGLRPGALNPWVEALLWGALGLAVAMIVVITVTHLHPGSGGA